MGPVLLGLGLMHYNLIVVAITTPISLFLTYLFLDWNGVTGVAWAQVVMAIITFFLVLIACVVAFKRMYGMNTRVST
jgi:hypothetical protein